MKISLAAIDSLRSAVQKVRQQRRKRLLLIQTSLSLLVICVLSILLVSLQMLLQFSVPIRTTLFCILLVAVICVLLWQNRQRSRFNTQEQQIAYFVEERLPQLEQRLLTSLEYSQQIPAGVSDQLVEQLWTDTHAKIDSHQIENISIPLGKMWPVFVLLPLLISMLLLLSQSHRFLAAAVQILPPWPQSVADATLPLQLIVEPGDAKMQRGKDVTLIARIENGLSGEVILNLQWDRLNWTRISMHAETDGTVFTYYLPAVDQPFVYYVETADLSSRRFTVDVFDLPQLVRLEVRYHYPPYTGMQSRREIDGGDIEAPEGTAVELLALFNKSLQEGSVAIQTTSAKQQEVMTIDGKTATVNFLVREDASYRIHVLDQEQLANENSGEFLIRVIPDAAPQIDLQKPGKDRKVMPLEEVVIAAQAKDDYGLTAFTLTYGAVGQEQQQVDFLATVESDSVRSSTGEHLLYLEDMDLLPGDFISYFLSATDNNGLAGPRHTISDIYFLEVIPTEAEFRRALGSAQSGGSRGATSSALVMIQKDIIAATWKLNNRKDEVTTEEFQRDADTIAQSQQQVLRRALMSLQRLTERQFFSDESYDRSVEFMGQAVIQMKAALDQLQAQQVTRALIPEQAALQAVMKAGASSRKREISANRSSRRGSAGRGREREELRELFEMEVGQLQNRYETPQQDSGENSSDDGALNALQELAKRQEKLNRAQRTFARRQEQMSEEQKRPRLEQLKRQQEALTRSTRQLAEQFSSTRDNENPEDPTADRRSSDLLEVAEQMQAAADSLAESEPGLAAAKSQKALDKLQRQADLIKSQQATSIDQLAENLKHKAEQISNKEAQVLADTEALMRQQNVVGGGDPANQLAIDNLLADKEELLLEIGEIERLLQAVIASHDDDRNDIKLDASAVKRFINSERIVDRIDTSKRLLQLQMLNVSFEIEKEIKSSIDGISSRLISLDQMAEPSDDIALQQAAVNARLLRRQIEELQKQTVSLADPSQTGAGRLDELRQSLARIRALSRSLAKPSQNWFAEARVIERQLNRNRIEQFLSRPDLLRQLLIPVIALEKKLAAHSQIGKLRQRLLVNADEEVPTKYEELVQQYYKSLSVSRMTASGTTASGTTASGTTKASTEVAGEQKTDPP